MRCQLVFLSVIIFVDVLFKSLELVAILMNYYFDKVYGLVFGLLILPALAGAIIINVTICS